MSGSAFGLPGDMPRCDLCGVAVWSGWATKNRAAVWCTSCALVVSLDRIEELSASHDAGRRRNAG